MKPTIFHPQADDEFAEALARYADGVSGLGDRFYENVLRLVAEIEATPRLHRPSVTARGATSIVNFTMR